MTWWTRDVYIPFSCLAIFQNSDNEPVLTLATKDNNNIQDIKMTYCDRRIS